MSLLKHLRNNQTFSGTLLCVLYLKLHCAIFLFLFPSPPYSALQFHLALLLFAYVLYLLLQYAFLHHRKIKIEDELAIWTLFFGLPIYFNYLEQCLAVVFECLTTEWAFCHFFENTSHLESLQVLFCLMQHLNILWTVSFFYPYNAPPTIPFYLCVFWCSPWTCQDKSQTRKLMAVSSWQVAMVPCLVISEIRDKVDKWQSAKHLLPHPSCAWAGYIPQMAVCTCTCFSLSSGM